MRDFAEVKAAGLISAEVAIAALDMLEVDPQGFDMLDRKLLLTVIEKFEGGPVGVDSLAAAMSEERGTIEDVIEPFLIQQGFLMRTARGRVATRNAYAHFGLAAPAMERDMNLPLFRDATNGAGIRLLGFARTKFSPESTGRTRTRAGWCTTRTI